MKLILKRVIKYDIADADWSSCRWIAHEIGCWVYKRNIGEI